MLGALDHWVQLAGCGLIVGVLVGATGVGAGSLTTPLLIVGFGVPPAVAVGTDLLFASITKAGAAWRHHRLGTVDWAVLRALALGSLPAASAVLAWVAIMKPSMAALAAAIRSCLVVVLLASAIAIALYPWLTPRDGPTRPASLIEPPPTSRRWTIALGALLGALVAMTSVGAGAIGVVVLSLLYPLMPARRLVGTDIAHAVPLTFLCGMGHLSIGHIDWRILIVLLMGSIPGIAIGSRVTGFLPDWMLRLLLAAVLVLAAMALMKT